MRFLKFIVASAVLLDSAIHAVSFSFTNFNQVIKVYSFILGMDLGLHLHLIVQSIGGALDPRICCRCSSGGESGFNCWPGYQSDYWETLEHN
jgi:hypothetical protein